MSTGSASRTGLMNISVTISVLLESIQLRKHAADRIVQRQGADQADHRTPAIV